MAGYADDGFTGLGPMTDALRKIAMNIEDISEIDASVRALLVPERRDELES